MIINDEATLAEMQAVFASYEAALLVNDTETLDGLFWRSHKTIRYGVNENQYGADAIAAFRALGPSTDPKRVLKRTVITTFGTDYATASTLFESPSQPGRLGRQMQTWARIDGAWKVVAAHVSVIDSA